MTSLRFGKSALAALALGVSVLVAPMAMAADASINDVYAAAQAGQVDKALDMMAPVLKDHPNSAKAHYVEAELLARAGRLSEARAELASAEKIQPGLGFAKPGAVNALKRQLAGNVAAAPMGAPVVAPEAERSHFPWLAVIVGGGLLFVLLGFLRRRSAAAQPYPQQMSGGFPGSPGYNPAGPSYGAPGYGAPGYGAPQQGGMGSGIIGNLAAGAAAGAGFAAGERLIDGVFGNHEHEGGHVAAQPQWDNTPTNTDMGGNDFGISDDSSWDSGSGGGDDSW